MAVDRLINRIELTEGQRKVIWVAERPTGSAASRAYEREAEGHLLDALTEDSIVPALPYQRTLPGVTISDFKKFDGIKRTADGSLTTTLIDRKLVNIFTTQKPGFREGMRRTISCLKDLINRQAGYTCVIQVPSPEVASAILNVVDDLGGTGLITIEVVRP